MGKQTRSYNLNPIKLSLATATDATSNLNSGTVTEDGSGNLVFTVPSGAAAYELDESVAVLWRVQDVDGTPGTWGNGTFTRSVNHWLYEKGSPDLTADTFIGVGVVDSSDLSAANGILYYFAYGSSATAVGVMTVSGGTGTRTVSGAGTIDRIFGNGGQAADAGFWNNITGGYNGSYESRVLAAVRSVAITMTGDQYWIVCAGRTLTTSADEELSATVYASPTNQLVNPE